MRLLLAAALALTPSPALAQFPPPGIYACTDAADAAIGTISLLVAGDYQWQGLDGTSTTGQVASAGDSVEALTGPLAQKHWKGGFETDAGKTTFVFDTNDGRVVCK